MNHSTKTRRKRNIKKMLWIGTAWMIIGFLQEIFVFLINSQYNSAGTTYQFVSSIIILMPALFISGLMGGYVISYLLEDWLRSKPFKSVLLFIIVLYTIIFFIAAFIGTIVNANVIQDENTFGDFTLPIFEYIRHYIFWLIVTLGTMITLQVSDKYGPGGFRSLLLGKYFRPKREDRIFMFLDLRSSTTIAEKLGEEQYFHFLRQCFADITNPILNYHGEIYQYVGDEVVVSWPIRSNQYDADCIECYFEIQKVLAHQEDQYLKSFGFAPTFKAGIHMGSVTAGEIGIIKKDIVYSGDVLNTAARIQAECNNYDVEILISSKLKDNLEFVGQYAFQEIGHVALRGKSEVNQIFTVIAKKTA